MTEKMHPSLPVDLEAEVSLDPAIEFQSPASKSVHSVRRVLLTGATGFLGTHLLHELLRQTGALIYCLVRPSVGRTAHERVKQSLTFYQRWESGFSERIVCLEGDLSEQRLGLSSAQYVDLSENADVIVHNGASVNITLPYSRARGPNVAGTHEILRLAAMGRYKSVHYISTMGIFFSDSVACISETDRARASHQRNGYQQSKWVAESLVRLAQERGLSASIYRAVRILGDAEHGIIGNFDDFLFMIIEACIRLGIYPLVNGTINFIPMDYASGAIVHILRQSKSLGRTYHLAHQQPVSWQTFFELIIAMGYPMRGVSYGEWCAAIDHAAVLYPERRTFSLLRMVSRFPNNIFSPKPAFDDRNTQECLMGSGIRCPAVDLTLLETYFRYFRAAGLVPEVERTEQPAQTA